LIDSLRLIKEDEVFTQFFLELLIFAFFFIQK